MQIRVRKQVVETVDVPAPAVWYRRQDTSGDDYTSMYYSRLVSTVERDCVKIVETAIHWDVRDYSREREEYAISIEVHGPFSETGESVDYILGRGEYALTEEAWQARRAEALAWIAKSVS